MRGGRIDRQNQISEKRLEQSRGRRKSTFILGGGAAAGAAAVVVLVPVLAVGGIVRGVNNSKVNNQIESRRTLLPIVLQEEEENSLHIFFPLSQSPQQLELTYVNSQGELTLIVDTHAALSGLHLVQATKR